MKVDEVIREAIERVGGKWKADRDGSYWEAEENGFVVQAEPFMRTLTSGQVWLGLDCSTCHSEFAKVANFILGKRPKNFVSLRWFQKNVEVASLEQATQAFCGLMTEVLNELKAEKISCLIDEFKSTRPDSPSMPQIRHLAALAWSKDDETLEEYQATFAAGGRLNFVPMITKAMIDRALEVALN
ncbi:DUF6990 domain-containing protein [Methylobacillus flagellatus]|uniref:DUF6990 domain-containing protein n=1 Tax=Methylobacillus flagellatus TaxID=405 RepID=UPI0010F4D8E6|nr:hypothetical protein [Methylobacillus flagellatus]